MADMIVITVVAGLVFLAVAILYKNKKSGKSSCGCDCGSCCKSCDHK